MLQNIIGGLLALIVILVALGFVLPDKVAMEREITINAPREKVFGLISDFNEWDAWSPWAKLDPDAEYKLTGQGLGQAMSWRGNNKVGVGSQEITGLEAPSSITTHLLFEGMGEADASFTLTPAPDGATKVVWAFESNMREGMALHMKPVATYMGFFMDAMLGPQYEQGLEDLKTVAEESV